MSPTTVHPERSRGAWWSLCLLLTACALPRTVAPTIIRDGLEVIEANAPDGLSYRLWHTPNGARQRLAVWLHPSRDSGEAMIQPLAPLLARHGYALLVPLKSEYLGWTSAEIKALFAHTLPHVARRPDIDAQLPLVIGFSAGGQMALHLWQKAPDALGGVVVIGTVPALVSDNAATQLPLPSAELAAGTAVLSFVGEQESGASAWAEAAPAWLTAGIPLTLKIVPERGHQWLISEPEQTLLDSWLSAISESSTTPHPGG